MIRITTPIISIKLQLLMTANMDFRPPDSFFVHYNQQQKPAKTNITTQLISAAWEVGGPGREGGRGFPSLPGPPTFCKAVWEMDSYLDKVLMRIR